MNVSDITLGDADIRIEGGDDGYNRWPVRCYDGQAFHRDRYIERHGDVAVVWDEKYRVFRVPSLQDKRDGFSAAKSRDCDRRGNE